MVRNRFFSCYRVAALLVMFVASSCTQTNNASPEPAFPTTSILDSGSVITFRYSTGDSLSQSTTYRFIVDSTHRSVGGKSNVSFWSDGNANSLTINYGTQGFEVMPTVLFFSYTGTLDWAPFPFGYAGSVVETRRIDTSFDQSGNLETASLRDTLRNLGTEYDRVGGEQMVTLHFQGSEYIQQRIPQLNASQTNRVGVDYWYAPLAGYFVLQERVDSYQSLHERIEIVAFSPN